MLKGKVILCGVCGGIAAYKTVELVSRLKYCGAEVHVIMTANATRFVTPLTFQSISRNPVSIDMFEAKQESSFQHLDLAARSDLLIIAPATANMISKAANGIADDLLSTSILAFHNKILIIPSMNSSMYGTEIVQENIHRLQKRGYLLLEPERGSMANGTTGIGRFPHTEKLIERIQLELI
ncbi:MULTISPECIES: flavoprotein [Paenibacillus]|uniref:flavoprotein n=1 Tax=Paenibacillus TaxID=44249 RepID=UPI00035E6F78|nr:flavoprotein [Paenibacillus massiliensis]